MYKWLALFILVFTLGGCGDKYVNSYTSVDHYVRDLLEKSAVTVNRNCDIHVIHSGHEVLRNWLVCPGMDPVILPIRETFQIREVYAFRLTQYQPVLITYDPVKERWVVK